MVCIVLPSPISSARMPFRWLLYLARAGASVRVVWCVPCGVASSRRASQLCGVVCVVWCGVVCGDAPGHTTRLSAISQSRGVACNLNLQDEKASTEDLTHSDTIHSTPSSWYSFSCPPRIADGCSRTFSSSVCVICAPAAFHSAGGSCASEAARPREHALALTPIVRGKGQQGGRKGRAMPGSRKRGGRKGRAMPGSRPS